MPTQMPVTLHHANIRWSNEGHPVSTTFDDVYFNSDGGIEESRHVFLEQNELLNRWGNQSGGTFTIGETGFGAGLNFLVTAQTWLDHLTADADSEAACLHFVSVEKYPLSKNDLEQALKLWPEFKALSDELIQLYPPAICGVHRLKLANNRIILTLLFGEANHMLSALKGSDHPLFQRQGNPVVDAWFLDGFSPAKNPKMWSEELFQTIADLSDAGTTFSTFTSASNVRSGLAAAGFEVEKKPGLHNKREMLHGKFANPTTVEVSESEWVPATFNSRHQPAWYLTPTIRKPEAAIVLGGGIAGCSTARALAERGVQVTLIERHPALGQEGSGNPQGILYPKLSTGTSQLARFGLAALLHASRYHSKFLNGQQAALNKSTGQRCGVLVLPQSEKDKQQFQKIAELFPEELVQLLSGVQLKETAGISLASAYGLFFPMLGWINPPSVCQMLAEHPLITVQTAEVADITYEHGCWQAKENTGNTIASAPAMVIACGFDSGRFSQTNHLPIKKIRGQITSLPTTIESEKLQTVLCGEGYIAPATNDVHTLGATYNFHETSTEISADDHQTNLKQLVNTDQGMADAFIDTTRNHSSVNTLAGRAAFRCTTPDYLPIAGPAPKLDDYLLDYDLLRKNARSHIPIAGSVWPGLYLNIGHGSRGLSYAPMCAEILASQICSEVPALELDLRQALHPGRFIIRDLKRHKR